MPAISYDYMALWSNYHRTRNGQFDAAGHIREVARMFVADTAEMSGPERFAATGRTLNDFYASVLAGKGGVIPMPPARDCVPAGRGWSFSGLAGAYEMQIDMSSLAGCSAVAPIEMHAGAVLGADQIALVSGGTRLRELVNWAESRGKSIRTSGTHLGMTVAGGAATASHGSRLGYGGIQNQIAGMHIVTGPQTSVWIERATKVVLSDDCVAKFSTLPPIRDDARFDDALIHLGAMGIVNGVAFELAENDGYDLLAVLHPVNQTWLERVAENDMRSIAAELGHDEDPVFYEATIDPWAFDGPTATHIMYFKSDMLPDRSVDFSRPRGSDAVAKSPAYLAQKILKYDPVLSPLLHDPVDPPELPPGFSVFGFYAYELFEQTQISTGKPGASWGGLHADEITGGYPGALYNASFSVRPVDIPAVIPLICKAMTGLDPVFLFTLRFVDNAAGTLAFTRFPKNVVIEIDGFSEKAPVFGHYGHNTSEGARRIRQTLDDAKIQYGMHWAKLGDLNAPKVIDDFGPLSDAGSAIRRWQDTRDFLLSSEMRGICWNDALVHYGLV